MRVLVVRHGHAEPKQAWRGADAARPLVARGHQQAKALAKSLGHLPTAILSSPALRCRQTIEPLAKASGLETRTCPALEPDAGDRAVDLIDDLIATAPTSAYVVLCTHREVINDLLPALSRRFCVDLGHRLPGGKGGFWMLDFRKGKLVRVKYLPPKK